MIQLTRREKQFAGLSIVIAMLHFLLETGAHLLWPQFLPMLLVDYIAVGLILAGAIGLLRWKWGPGLLCGGWGFEFCLNYRTFFWRVDAMLNGSADTVVTNTAYVLGAMLFVSVPCFAYAVVVCIQQHRRLVR